ncbi:MAG: Uma2 family endonuclease [Acidimicrobiales bacterium]
MATDLQDLIARRRATGADLYDEIWDGEYHMAPAAHPFHGYLDDQVAGVLHPLAQRSGLVGTGPFNLGTSSNYRVPDHGFHRALPTEMWVPTAALVVEVLSPGDESWKKLGFYAAHDVDEILVVDGEQERLTWLARRGVHYDEVTSSTVVGVPVAEVAAAVTWPRRLA